ncbi:inactive leucine-rich repeat receptor-like protein kinase CORYNE [Zingiber officinale]|uniref:inactive leucine-rich repeat receptor-like protein kinase CORYNE n=1 Tax=Zingiber officinale TaxID=94328 RepID=UPI001C4ACBBF|nr:inactive leucine-rich repeat receptor-like protein kinase CORYNE [Zingiber officinale]
MLELVENVEGKRVKKRSFGGFPMGGKNPSKTLSLVFLTLFAIEACAQVPQSEAPVASPLSKAPPKFAHNVRLRRMILGALFGSLTGFVASLLFLLSVRLLLLCACRPPILKGPVVFSPAISPKALQSALSGDAQSIPNGKYYRVVLEDSGLTVAAKRLLLGATDAGPPANSDSHKRRVQHELELLARVKHRNVMSLRAYIREQEHVWLVYDYLAGGSLEETMVNVRADQLKLAWDVRHRIAVGIAKGLRYLHFECGRRILHYSLKPSNVMLEEGCEPRLADFGLAMLANYRMDAPSTAYYAAPECFQSCRYTEKSDIYSFGMILGVLLTGKDPSHPFFAGETGRGSLGRWIRHLQQVGEARQALDVAMLGEELEEEEMLMAIRIAIVCMSDLPADRPSSDELVSMLTQLHSF